MDERFESREAACRNSDREQLDDGLATREAACRNSDQEQLDDGLATREALRSGLFIGII